PGTQCQVADCGSGGSCVAGGCSGGPTPGKSCCYGGGVCSHLPVCPGCCGAPPTTLDVGAFNAGFNSTLRMWGPNIGTGSTFGTITFDGNQFIFNPPLPGIGSGCSVTGGVITCNGIKLHGTGTSLVVYNPTDVLLQTPIHEMRADGLGPGLVLRRLAGTNSDSLQFREDAAGGNKVRGGFYARTDTTYGPFLNDLAAGPCGECVGGT